jgi:hypothetical protein
MLAMKTLVCRCAMTTHLLSLRRSTMKLRWAVLALGSLALAGCAAGSGTTSPLETVVVVQDVGAASPLFVSPGAASYAAPMLGIVTDPELRVAGTVEGSAAEIAGVQVGDVLLDLAWIPADAFPYTPLGAGHRRHYGFELSAGNGYYGRHGDHELRHWPGRRAVVR